MTYQLLEQYSSAFVGPAMVPKGFAIHWWGDPAQKPTFDAIVNVLLERGRQQSASVNFIAEAGLVACLVSSTNVAWGQGDGGTGWGNLNLVSIECNPRCTAADRETVAELMADQHILNGVPLVAYPHNKFTATQCPGVWEQYIPWLVSRAKQIVAAKQGKDIAPQGTTTTPTKPKEDALSAAEVTQIINALESDGEKTREYIKALAYSGWNDDKGKKHPGFMLVGEVTQQRQKAQTELIAALSKNPDLTPEQITASVKAGLASGKVEYDVKFSVAGGTPDEQA